MIHHFKSHHLTDLAEKLAESLKAYQPDDPLEPQVIVVPNLDTSRWLKSELAGKMGIAANLQFLLPSEWQWNRIRQNYPELPKKLPSDLEPMKWALCEILSDDKFVNRYGVLKNYLAAQEGSRRSGALFQLAGEIAYLFDQYQMYRPDKIVSWQKGFRGEGDEVWQSELWRVYDTLMKERHQGLTRLNRAELFLNAPDMTNEGSETNKILYLFNPGLLPKITAKMFHTYGKSANLFLFQIQPSREISEFRNELLQSFGDEACRVGEILKTERAKIESIFSAGSDDSDLKIIQESIVQNRSITESGVPSVSLNGIEIRSCHTALREVETLHQFLLEQFEKDDTLYPDDILVVMPHPERYEAAIHAVFGASEDTLPQIPYHISGRRASDEFGSKHAFEKLLKIADSRFTFSDVMDLLSIKAIFEAYGLSEADTELIRQWMKENHVIWGLEASHKAEWNQPSEKLQTWKEAIRRGWLGQWMEGDKTQLVNDVLLFGGADSVTKQKIWAALSAFLNDLDQLRKDAKLKNNGSEWAHWLENLLKQFVSDQALMQPASVQILRCIEEIKNACDLVSFNGAISFSEIRQELLSKLRDHSAGSANFNRGVVFSSMVPVRSIPFKIIALIGINEDAFPRKPKVPEFDLMVQQPEPQDRNRKEEDRNLFLESILAAEKVHYCSYIGQSAVDNEMIPPSSITSEWLDILSVYSGLKPGEIIQKEPLNSFSATLFTKKKSYSRQLFNTAAAIQSKTGKIAGLQIQPIPEDSYPSVIEVNDFIGFFGNPIKWFVQNRLGAGFYSSENDKNEFEIDSLEKHLLFQRVFGWYLNEMPESKMQNLLIQSGALPTGQAGRFQLNEIIENVKLSFQVFEKNHFKPVSTHLDISFSVENFLIEGSLHSYSKDTYLAVTPSGVSGKHLFLAWIGHLAGLCSGKIHENSFLITNLKKDGPKLFRFKPPVNPATQLSDLFGLYQSGYDTPALFFPVTLYEYVSNQKVNTPDYRNKARMKFEGSEHSPFSESDDEYVKCLLGDDLKFSDELVQERYISFFETMCNHMEEVKQ